MAVSETSAALCSRLMKGFLPPEDLTVSQWAAAKRRLSAEASAEPGAWRNERTPYLVEVMDAFNDPTVKHIVLVAASQVGKALDINTPLPTPTGWTTMGEVNVGDEIYDENGRVCRVTFATDIMYNRPCYKITFSDGAVITCDKEHRWYVEVDRSHAEPKGMVLTTGDMVHCYKNGRRNRFAVPVAKAIDCEKKELIIPPYTFGYWLGDGHSYSAQLAVGVDDIEVLGYIEDEGIETRVVSRKKNVLTVALGPEHSSECCIRGHKRVTGLTGRMKCPVCQKMLYLKRAYGIEPEPVVVPEKIYSKLSKLNVIGNKHIPKEYLRASYNQRLSLLCGILDSDGSISKTSGRVEITLKSKQLIDDVSELLYSLGIKHTLKSRTTVCGNSATKAESVVYRISFLVYDTPVFRLSRKLKHIKRIGDTGRSGGRLRTSETLRRRIVKIEPCDSVPVRCIQVDSGSHLYLCGREMIPTHNTEAELNCIGYIIDQDPGSILFVHPTSLDAKEFSKLRIAPMIRDTPTLNAKVADPKQRDSANTILQKSYPGGILTLCGSTEAHALASKPIRYIIGDEMDRWSNSAGNEGDPWELAMARQTTFYNAKAIEVSTPTIHNASRIETAYGLGTMERYKTQCPHCENYHEIKWDNIRFDYEEHTVGNRSTYEIKEIVYVCPECGGVSQENVMKRQPARWEAENPDAKRNGTRSFWLNAFVSKWASWQSIVLKFLQAHNNPQKLQVVYNTCFGLPWENRIKSEDESALAARREEYEAELPEGVLVLTCGIDTQDDRLEYEVVGHGHFGETWGIQRGVIMGVPDDRNTWEQLDMILDKVYRYKDGIGLRISMAFMDEGGHYTQDVRQNCRTRQGKKLFCIKGFPGSDKPYTAPPKQMKIVVGKKEVGWCWQYQIGVDAGKTSIMDSVKVQQPGARYMHFPRNADYGERYFAGLLSERLIYDEKKKNPWVWEKIPGHERNEPLDCRNYAMAAFKALNIDIDAVERKLLEARGKKNDTSAPATTVRATPKKSAKSKMSKYYDEW